MRFAETLILSTALLVAPFSPVVNAHPDATEQPERVQAQTVNKRQMTQQSRIRAGVRSGELTREEAKGARADQKELRQKESEYKSDGEFTRAERMDLQKDLNTTSKKIYQEKHDGTHRR